MKPFKPILNYSGFTFYPYVLEDFMWFFLTLIYGVNRHSLVILAINRFVALYFPSRYNLLCGIWSTLVIIASIFKISSNFAETHSL